jgi:hypothetical protein
MDSIRKRTKRLNNKHEREKMGNRSNIVIRETASQKDNLVILYGHWAGDDNLTAVKNVLEKTDRIGDSIYLTAQIFHEFTSLGGYDGGLGYGLWVGDIESIDEADNPAVIVDADTGAITYNGKTVEPCECNSCVSFH